MRVLAVLLSSLLSCGLAAAQVPTKTEALPYLKMRAQRLFESTNYLFCVEHLRHAIEKYPADGDLRLLLGECQFELDRPREAAEAFAAGLEREPSRLNRVPHYPLALFRDGRIDEAQAVWKRMLESGEDAGIENGEYGLGLVAAEHGDQEDALAHFRRARVYDADSSKINYRIGATLFRMGRLEEAYEALRQVAEQDPLHEPALHNLALVAMRLGRRDEALAWKKRHEEARGTLTRISNLRLALSRNANDFGALAELADVYFEVGYWSRAEGLYRALVVENQQDPEPRFRNAWCLYKQGRIVELRQQLEIILRRHPDHAASLALKAELDAKKGENDRRP